MKVLACLADDLMQRLVVHRVVLPIDVMFNAFAIVSRIFPRALERRPVGKRLAALPKNLPQRASARHGVDRKHQCKGSNVTLGGPMARKSH